MTFSSHDLPPVCSDAWFAVWPQKNCGGTGGRAPHGGDSRCRSVAESPKSFLPGLAGDPSRTSPVVLSTRFTRLPPITGPLMASECLSTLIGGLGGVFNNPRSLSNVVSGASIAYKCNIVCTPVAHRHTKPNSKVQNLRKRSKSAS